MLISISIMIGKIAVMIILLVSMVLLLFGIGHIFHNDDLNTVDDNRALKDELKKNENVIGEKSVFSNFLVKNYAESRNHKNR